MKLEEVGTGEWNHELMALSTWPSASKHQSTTCILNVRGENEIYKSRILLEAEWVKHISVDLSIVFQLQISATE